MTYQYQHEMTDKDHNNLVDILLKINGKAILSGYDNEIYNKLSQNGWQKIILGKYDKRSMKAINTSRDKGEEFVWINYILKNIKFA
jgi:site-specific DNA-adenine methylase